MSKEYEPQTVKELTDMVNSSLKLWGMSDEAYAKLINLSENATFCATDPKEDPNKGHSLILRCKIHD